jgi:hypothetical protein
MKYTAVVLTAPSRSALLKRFRKQLPRGWDVEAHHMTINLGAAADGPASGLVGQAVELRVVTLARGETVVAVGVESPLATQTALPHITLAVNVAAGGRSRDSNTLSGWKPVEPLAVQGTIQEID